jgi:cell division protein FtsQ
MSSVFAIRAHGDRPAGRALPRWARPMLIALSCLCGVFLLGRYAAMPLMTIRHIEVRSEVPLAEDQVLALSGIGAEEHWYSLPVAAIQRRLEAHALVRHAAVQKVFPDTVRLTLWARQPVALVLAEAGGRSIPVLVDGDAVIYKLGATSAELDLPVVSGLAVGQTGLGAVLPPAYAALFADLRALRERSPSLYGLLSEVRVVGSAPAGAEPGSAPSAGSEIVIYLTCSPVAVRARGALDESLLKYALMVIDLLSKQGGMKDIQELDFRSGDVVYRTKGG